MKVLHIIGGGDIGGAKAHVLTLVRELSEYIDVKLVSLRHGPFADDAKKMGINIQVIKSGNVIRDISTVKKLIQNEDYKIIHSHGAKANMFSAILKRQTDISSVTTVHSDYKLDYMHSYIKHITYGTINKIALRHIDFHIGVSNKFKKMLIDRNFDPSGIYTVYNGMDFSDIEDSYDKKSLIENYNLPIKEDDIIVGIAARLDPVKGIDTLIKSASVVKEQNPNVKFVIGGDGDEMKNLKALTKSLDLNDTVFFTGWLNDPYELIAVTDISVLTSISESFPYSILEGAKYKKATVSSAVGGIPDLITHGENGYLFTPGDYKTLASHLVGLAGNNSLRKKMGENIYEKASKHFSLKKMCKTQIEIYENIYSIFKDTKYKGYKYDCILVGYYGFNNIGDDALLSSICKNLQQFKPNVKILALSKNPKETMILNRINSIKRTNIFKIIRAFKNSKLFAFGGGTLIQDSTSTRSLIYYLALMYLAKKLKLKTMLYANGVEPIKKHINKKLTGRIINNVDIITLRENISGNELKKLNVDKPKIINTADPAITCKGINPEEIKNIFIKEGIPTNKKYVGFSMRFWKEYGKKYTAAIARLADFLRETYDLLPVFIPMQHKYIDDCKISREIIGKMETEAYLIKDRYSVSETIGIISKLDMIVGMRLHSLIFAANKNIPMVGIAYEPKVSWFLRYIGMGKYCTGPVNNMTYENLKKLSIQALERKDSIITKLKKTKKELYDKSMENAKLAIKLMED